MSEEKKAAPRIVNVTPEAGMPVTPEIIAKIDKLLGEGKAIQMKVCDLPPELADLKAELQAKGIQEVVAVPHEHREGVTPDVNEILDHVDQKSPSFSSKNFGIEQELVDSLAELGVKPAQYVVNIRTKHRFSEDFASEFARDVFSPQVAEKLVAAGVVNLAKLKETPPEKLKELGFSIGAVAMVCRGMYAIMEEGIGQTPEQRQALRSQLMRDKIEASGGLEGMFERLGLSPELIVAFERLALITGVDVMDIVTGDPNKKVQAFLDNVVQSGNADLLEKVQDAFEKLTQEQARLREMMAGGMDSAALADDPNIVQLLPDDFRNPEVAKVVGSEIADTMLEIGITSIAQLMDDAAEDRVSEAMFKLDPTAARREEFQQRLQTGRALTSRCGCSHCVSARAVYKASKMH